LQVICNVKVVPTWAPLVQEQAIAPELALSQQLCSERQAGGERHRNEHDQKR